MPRDLTDSYLDLTEAQLSLNHTDDRSTSQSEIRWGRALVKQVDPESSRQCCQLDDFLARFGDFSVLLSDLISKKRLATNLARNILHCNSHAGQSHFSPRLHCSGSGVSPVPSHAGAQAAGQCVGAVWGRQERTPPPIPLWM